VFPPITYNHLFHLMSYTVLARKYRPQKFSEVIGQEHVTRTLQNALEQGRTAHGYIFSGHRGIGKTTVARILAAALNCRSSDKPVAEPCGICESCTEIRAGNAVDVIEIDAATNRGIDEIRELREAARYRPARDRFKIYILDEAHQITDAAFNALLKTLDQAELAGALAPRVTCPTQRSPPRWSATWRPTTTPGGWPVAALRSSRSSPGRAATWKPR